MSYKSWFYIHAKKHQDIVDKLVKKGYYKAKIIEYFRWENISKSDENFCPLFKDSVKCHDIENLNCFLCACPYFRFNDDAKVEKSFCSIESKNGKILNFNGVSHQDCSDCLIPHQEKFINKVYKISWLDIMSKCED